jgi:hypothetical protein
VNKKLQIPSSKLQKNSKHQARKQRIKESTDTIIPRLEKAAQRKDNVSGYAKGALKQLESKAPANQGVKQ